MRLKIGELRKRAGLTQAELAERVGVTRPYLSQLENGDRNVSARLHKRIVAALNVDPETMVEPDTSFSDSQILLMAFEKMPEEWRKTIMEIARAYVQSRK